MSRSCGCTAAIVLVILVILFVVFGLPSCSARTQTTVKPQTSARSLFRFVVVADSQTADPFWSEVKQGVDQAAKKMNVAVTYLAPNTFNISTMSERIDAAIATHPDGLVVSVPDCTGLTPALKRAQLVGIPIISMNASSDCASKLGLLNHVGQGGYQIGLAAGQKLIDQGAKHVLCINPNVGNVDLDDRCRGISDALTHTGRRLEVLAVDLSDSALAQQTIQQKLAQDPSLDYAITLDTASATLAVNALPNNNSTKKVIFATFDLSPEISQAIREGTILFAIDQKPYWQGYLPIELMTQYRKHTSTLATPISMADPSFVTNDNVGQA